MPDELLDVLAGPPPKDKRVNCYTRLWLDDLEPDLRAAFETALDNTKWKTASLFALAEQRGFEKKYNTLRLHRVKDCSCD